MVMEKADYVSQGIKAKLEHVLGSLALCEDLLNDLIFYWPDKWTQSMGQALGARESVREAIKQIKNAAKLLP